MNLGKYEIKAFIYQSINRKEILAVKCRVITVHAMKAYSVVERGGGRGVWLYSVSTTAI